MAVLNLFDQLLARATRLLDLGLAARGLSLLRQLSTHPELPADVARDVHSRLGESYLRRRCYRRARHHLVAALRCQPDDARNLFLLGLAQHHDPSGDPARAARYYRRSLRLQPRQPRCLAEAGLLAIREGSQEEGLGRLRRAADLSPADAGIIGKLVQGFVKCEQPAEALRTVRLALFRNPRCQRLRRVWIDLELSLLRQKQETDRAATSADAPVLLPFLRVVRKRTEPALAPREDGPVTLPGPHLLRLRGPRGRRRVP